MNVRVPTAEDWKRALRLQILDAVEQYRAWRDGPRLALRVKIPGTFREKSVHDLTESEILAVAQREAEQDIIYAMHLLKQKH